VLEALGDDRYRGPINATAPDPPTNREFSKALGRALGRPAIAPIPALAIRALYGEMAVIVSEGQNAVPEQLRELGYVHEHPQLDEALRDALK
jgi:NAD dependent epimerase/dehydratase family enzyme